MALRRRSAVSAVSAGITLALTLPSYFPHTSELFCGEAGRRKEGGRMEDGEGAMNAASAVRAVRAVSASITVAAV